MESLNERFGSLIEEDCYKISTFLDSNFGMGYFNPLSKADVRMKVDKLIKAVKASMSNDKVGSSINNLSNKSKRVEVARENNSFWRELWIE